jgi:hypothetical protein
MNEMQAAELRIIPFMQHLLSALHPVADVERLLRESDAYWIIDGIPRES